MFNYFEFSFYRGKKVSLKNNDFQIPVTLLEREKSGNDSKEQERMENNGEWEQRIGKDYKIYGVK